MEQDPVGTETATPPRDAWPQPVRTEGTGGAKMGRPKLGSPRG